MEDPKEANGGLRIRGELSKIIVGQDEIVKLLLVSLFSRGHCILVGVPGLAKTLLVKSLSDVLDLALTAFNLHLI